MYDAVGFLGLYVVYIGVVLVGRFVNQRTRRNMESSEDQSGIIENEERDIDSGNVEIPGKLHAMMFGCILDVLKKNVIFTKDSLEARTSMKSDQVQRSLEHHHVESQNGQAQVKEGETRDMSDESNDTNASISNDDIAIRELTTTAAAITPQPGTSLNGTSIGGDDYEDSSVSSERFSEWRQFWTLLSPIPDGVEDFRWVFQLMIRSILLYLVRGERFFSER